MTESQIVPKEQLHDLLNPSDRGISSDEIAENTIEVPKVGCCSKYDEIIEISDDDPNKNEALKLGGKSSIKTISILMIGPLVSQLAGALYGVIDSMWVGKALGKRGMSAVSMFSNLENIGRAFGFFLSTAGSSQISYLFGQGLGEEAGQLIVDLIRCAFLSGAFVSAVLLPTAKPLGKWFGAEDSLTNDGFDYLLPVIAFSFVTCLYLLVCGCLQAEGRTFTVAAIQIVSLIFNMGLFDPLFLLVFKMNTPGAAYATVIAEAIPTIFVLFFYFRGKFGVKPKLNMFLKCFSKRTIPALKVGVSQLFANLSRSVPSIFLRKFMGMSAEHMENATFEDAAVGFNAVTRIFAITDSIRLASCMAYLPAASFAYSRKKYKRYFSLTFHASWINLVWGLGTMLFTAFGAKYVAMSISSKPEYLKWATPMLMVSNWEAPIAWVRNICQTSLQALQLGRRATLYSFFSIFVVYLLVATTLYYTNDHDFIRLMYTFPLTSSIALVMAIFVLISPAKMLIKEMKESQDGNTLENKNENGNTEEENNEEDKDIGEDKEGLPVTKFVDVGDITSEPSPETDEIKELDNGGKELEDL